MYRLVLTVLVLAGFGKTLGRMRKLSGILLHGTANKPAGSEIDVSLSYGDYYFIEALVRDAALLLCSLLWRLPRATT